MSDTYRVILQPEAVEGMESAHRFIEAESPQSARKWIVGLMKAIESLSSFPKRCPLAPEAGAFQQEIRQLVYGKRANVFRILFTVQGYTVHVLHIRHAARQRLPREESES